MRVVEQGLERFSRLHPAKQKAVEYFVASGLAASMAGVSIVPLIESGGTSPVGVLGVIGGSGISVTE